MHYTNLGLAALHPPADPRAILVHVANEAADLAPNLPLFEAVGSVVTHLRVIELRLEPIQLRGRHFLGADLALGFQI